DRPAAFDGGDRVGVGHGGAAELLDLLGHNSRAALLLPVAGQGRAHVVDDDLRTTTAEFEGMGPAQAPTGSRDHGDTAIEAEIHGSFLLHTAGRTGVGAERTLAHGELLQALRLVPLMPRARTASYRPGP